MVLVDLWASPATFTSGRGVPLCLLGHPKSWAKLEKGFLGSRISETTPSWILLFTFTRQHFPQGAKQTLVKNLKWTCHWELSVCPQEKVPLGRTLSPCEHLGC